MRGLRTAETVLTSQGDMTKFVKTVNPGVVFSEMQIEAIVGEVRLLMCLILPQ